MARSIKKNGSVATRRGGRVSIPTGKNQYMETSNSSSDTTSTTRSGSTNSDKPARPAINNNPPRPTSNSSARPLVNKEVLTKSEPKFATKIVKIPKQVTVYGNKDAKVVAVQKGDGDLNYTKIVDVTATPTIQYNSGTGNVKVSVRFVLDAYENEYQGKKDRSYLRLSKTVSVSQFVGKATSRVGVGAKDSNGAYQVYKVTETTVTPFLPNSNHKYGMARYKSRVSAKGFRELSPYSYPNENRHQEWMSIEDILVQADNKGSELDGINNLAFSAVMNFYFKVTTKTWTEYVESKVTGKVKVTTKPGTLPVQDAAVLDNIRSVVGCGYDITGKYISSDSLKANVVNIDAVNELKRIRAVVDRPYVERSTIKGESLSEYSSKLETSLNVKVSLSGFGASFSNETNTTNSTSKSTSENRSFLKLRSVFKNKEYQMQLDYKNNLNPDLLNAAFLNDLDSCDPDTIIQTYGTHVLLGAVYGASAFYNMSYVKSVSNITKASTFENTTSIGYSFSGGASGGKTNEKSDKKSAIAKLVDELGGIKDMSDSKFTELMKTYRSELEIQNKAKTEKDTKKDSSKSGSGSGSSSISKGFNSSGKYTESETESNSFENSTTEDGGEVFGGDWSLAANIRSGELEKIPDWERKCQGYSDSPENNTWCEFIPGTIIPIYEFVPVGCKISAEELRLAWNRYIESKGKVLTPTKQVTLSVPKGLSITGDNESVKNIGEENKHDDDDREISTGNSKTTGWKVRFELVNLESGKVAVVVQLAVGEGGLYGNKSLLMLHNPIEVGSNNYSMMVVDTTKYNCIYETEGSIFREEHNLFDVTRFFYDCPFLDFIGNPTNKVFIKVDGDGGNDSKNIQIKVDNFYVPVLVDENE